MSTIFDTEIQSIISIAGNSVAYRTAESPASFLAALSHVCEESACKLKADSALVERGSHALGVDLVQFTTDAAAVLGVGFLLQKLLTDKLRETSNPPNCLGQLASHLLVDHWGKLEAAKALLRGIVRTISLSPQAESATLRAEVRVLLDSLAELITEMGGDLGAESGFALVAPLLDWSHAVLRSPLYTPVEDAIEVVIRQASV